MLLEALARTAEPQRAFSAFDRFLAELPAGVQLFSLLRSNPSLLRLIADIMGSAPRLAQILSRRTRVLDAVLDPGFFGAEPTEKALADHVHHELDGARDYQDRLDRARIVGSEQAFLIGVRVLSGTIGPAVAGDRYARLAEVLVQEMAKTVEGEFVRVHGQMAGGSAAVLAMGKLGGREMAANSDLDLIVVYDYEGEDAFSLGRRPLPGQQYYIRYTQRLISAISAPTSEGRLYEVDMRLRPSGNAGPVASRLRTFDDYQRSAAWTWEHMALTRARVLSGTPALRQRIETIVHEVLTRKRDRNLLAADVREMRTRIAAEKGTTDIWDLKQVRGGLVDLEFMVQFLQLAHAHELPSVLAQNTGEALDRLAAAGVLNGEQSEVLLPAFRLYQALSQIIRLCLDGPFVPANAPSGLKSLLARAAEVPDFALVAAALVETETRVAALFDAIIR
jgi:glutamate-ammonia-ligase adenylyltransferase